MRVLRYPSRDFDNLTRQTSRSSTPIRVSVEKILSMVQRDGDQALLDLTARYDGLRIQRRQLKISRRELKQAKVFPSFAKAARQTQKNVEAFAKASLPRDWMRTNLQGGRVGEKFDPLQRIGVYIPGGQAPLVSTVYMTVAIARVAKVPEIVVCTPPPVNQAILWALNELGVTEVFRVGGAQAIAAMALGTESIRPVMKLFGPGNAFVTEAKRQVFGTVGIDLLAGPSELMILADSTTRTDWAAADLLAQAEHGSGRERLYCASTSLNVLNGIEAEANRQASIHKQAATILSRTLRERTHWILVKNTRELADVTNRIAPEHLQIMTRKPRVLAAKICTAGGIFLGNTTPTVLGDFVAGPSHTLPTGGAGATFSGLRVEDFMRRTSLVEYDGRSLGKSREGVGEFSRGEHLPLHGRSLEIRLEE